ncbi:ATP-binding protein [Streptomyces genisteinicus]|uniref:ATP-binding protein n=1 Tax=Streptomyces genisteinicus TaxID=2768068 RepID=UPI001FE83A27|nr:NB-ARC domain-containing protein [Streptomyces genisteinicus]
MVHRQLPPETNAFVGRAAECEELLRALAEHRLVTVAGPGGVGKTRLARRAGALVDEKAHRDGVRWADLGHLQGDRLLVATVSDAVDLSHHTPRMPADTLCAWLARQETLLVLDSCEHLVAPCAALVADLLTACPGLTVLVTSRQPLGLPGEHVLDLAPLPPGGPDAAELFRRRTGTALGTALPDTAAAAVGAVCRRLEGIPLAIELAAAQVPRFGVDGVRDRLAARFEVLESDDPARPLRHRTLRTAVGWSHELCEPAERLLWARLSVFRGPFDAGAAAEVCSGGPLDTAAVPAVLAGLVAKSVLRGEGVRLRMLDTVREYGAMWLDELGERHAVADRHAARCLRLARRAHAQWLGPSQAEWYARIAAAHTDLCTALDHLLATDPERALELAGTVGFFWACCGHLPETRHFVETALARSPGPGPHRARALWALGVALTLQGEYGPARLRSEECTRAARLAGDREDRLDAAYLAGLLALLTGEPETARREVDAAVEAAGTAGDAAAGTAGDAAPGGDAGADTGALVRCLLVRVFALTASGRLDEAREEATGLRERCAALGESWTRAYLNYQLALITLLTGDPGAAARHARSMLIGKRGLGDGFGVALGLDVLAAALAAMGEGRHAALVSGTSETYWLAAGHPQRGTPELAPLREECERRARTEAGDDAYDAAFAEGAAGVPSAGLAAALRMASAV